MNQDAEALLSRLVAIIRRIYADTEGMLDDPGDMQRWYDRGYANGMVQALRALGHGALLESQMQLDPEGLIAGHEPLAWGKAYLHGMEVGAKETYEVMGSNSQ